MPEEGSIHEEEHEMIEEMAGELYSPSDSEINLPSAWGTLRIDMTLMPEESRKKVYEAENLLNKAGVVFDTGSGGGYRDWELDWSLSGAYLKVRRLTCMGEHEPEQKSLENYAYWAILRQEQGGMVVSYAYCSERCRADSIARTRGIGYEVILNMEGRVELYG